MATEKIITAVVNGLADFMRQNILGLEKVYVDFPHPDQVLKMPCATVFTRPSAFNALSPYVKYRAETPNENNEFEVHRVVGNYEMQLQVDLWCQSKFERQDMFEVFFNGFNLKSEEMGISLPLPNYFDEIARFNIVRFEFIDTEEQSQRDEWRVRFDVTADVRVIQKTLAHLMETIENNLEISEDVLVAESGYESDEPII